MFTVVLECIYSYAISGLHLGAKIPVLVDFHPFTSYLFREIDITMLVRRFLLMNDFCPIWVTYLSVIRCILKVSTHLYYNQKCVIRCILKVVLTCIITKSVLSGAFLRLYSLVL